MSIPDYISPEMTRAAQAEEARMRHGDPAPAGFRCGKWVSDNDPGGPTWERCVFHNGHEGPCKGFTVGR
jgi:hypothetical protein